MGSTFTGGPFFNSASTTAGSTAAAPFAFEPFFFFPLGVAAGGSLTTGPTPICILLLIDSSMSTGCFSSPFAPPLAFIPGFVFSFQFLMYSSTFSGSLITCAEIYAGSSHLSFMSLWFVFRWFFSEFRALNGSL